MSLGLFWKKLATDTVLGPILGMAPNLCHSIGHKFLVYCLPEGFQYSNTGRNHPSVDPITQKYRSKVAAVPQKLQ